MSHHEQLPAEMNEALELQFSHVLAAFGVLGASDSVAARRLLKKAKQPLIIQGLIEGWPLNETWSKESVFKTYGALAFFVSAACMLSTIQCTSYWKLWTFTRSGTAARSSLTFSDPNARFGDSD